MKEFFGIKQTYKFEVNDLCAFLAIANVLFIVLGFWWAPLFGLANCCLGIVLNIKARAHINLYLTQLAFVYLNVFFLVG